MCVCVCVSERDTHVQISVHVILQHVHVVVKPCVNFQRFLSSKCTCVWVVIIVQFYCTVYDLFTVIELIQLEGIENQF